MKRDANGQVQRYKARLVARGCSQRYEIYYAETFSPACRMESIRFILSLAVQLKLHMHQMYVCTAYLNSGLTAPRISSQRSCGRRAFAKESLLRP